MKVQKSPIQLFRKQFGTEEQCRNYLACLKWENKRYTCAKCGHNKYVKGRVHLDRKCQQCGRNESPTSGTVFHSTKLSLPVFFEIIYRISVSKKGLSALAIAREYGVNQKTADLIRRKIQHAMNTDNAPLMRGIIHVDEFFVGGTQKRKFGRSQSDKKKAVIAIEILENNKIGRAYAMSIENFGANELYKVFEKHIDREANVVTDEWQAYTSLMPLYQKLIRKRSEKGKAFPQMHITILNIKNWLRGVHHSISSRYFQDYLNEFSFRFNHKGMIKYVPFKMIDLMSMNKPLKLKNVA
jgi:transposase-like protein